MLLFIAGCKVTNVEQNNQQRYSLINEKDLSNEDSSRIKDVSASYVSNSRDCLEFMITINNRTSDTILVEPSKVYYTVESDTTKASNRIYCINSEKYSSKLIDKRDSLLRMKNPYSLSSKSTKEVAKEGLVKGTIATVLGMKPEDLEKQRKNDEDDWEDKHNAEINKIKNEIYFYENNALKQDKILPNNKIKGIIVFPLPERGDGINLYIPICNDFKILKFKRVK
jgi:hypothetical protein